LLPMGRALAKVATGGYNLRYTDFSARRNARWSE
jgi:hypothetical protein